MLGTHSGEEKKKTGNRGSLGRVLGWSLQQGNRDKQTAKEDDRGGLGLVCGYGGGGSARRKRKQPEHTENLNGGKGRGNIISRPAVGSAY